MCLSVFSVPFGKKNLKILLKSNLPVFLNWAFSVWVEKCLSNLKIQENELLCFLLESVYSFECRTSDLSPIWVNLGCDACVYSSSSFCGWLFCCSYMSIIKDDSFSDGLLWYFCQESVSVCVWICFWTLLYPTGLFVCLHVNTSLLWWLLQFNDSRMGCVQTLGFCAHTSPPLLTASLFSFSFFKYLFIYEEQKREN